MITNKNKKTKLVKQAKKTIQKTQTDEFKRRYFDYYDDVKSPTHDVVDWWAVEKMLLLSCLIFLWYFLDFEP